MASDTDTVVIPGMRGPSAPPAPTPSGKGDKAPAGKKSSTTVAPRPVYPVDLSVTVERGREPGDLVLRVMSRSVANSVPPAWPEFATPPPAPWKAPSGEVPAHLGAWAIFLIVALVAALPLFTLLLALWTAGHVALAASHSWKHLLAVAIGTATTGTGFWFVLTHVVAPHLH